MGAALSMTFSLAVSWHAAAKWRARLDRMLRKRSAIDNRLAALRG
jgi:hypothetical protein